MKSVLFLSLLITSQAFALPCNGVGPSDIDGTVGCVPNHCVNSVAKQLAKLISNVEGNRKVLELTVQRSYSHIHPENTAFFLLEGNASGSLDFNVDGSCKVLLEKN